MFGNVFSLQSVFGEVFDDGKSILKQELIEGRVKMIIYEELSFISEVLNLIFFSVFIQLALHLTILILSLNAYYNI
jgi:hypothetical protein